MSAAVLLTAQGRGRPSIETMWDSIAYVCRYGKQPVSEVLCMTMPDLRDFKRAIGRIVEQENAPKDD